MKLGVAAFLLVSMAACSPGQSEASSGPGSADKAGVLEYTGDYRGEVAFKDSDCHVMDGHLLAFNAPHEKDGVPASKGMSLGITFEKSGVPTQVVFALDDGTAQNEFMKINQNKPIHGLLAKKTGGEWQVDFQGLELPGSNFLVGAENLQDMAASKQKAVVLHGVLHCTRVH